MEVLLDRSGTDLLTWLASNREQVEERLTAAGAVLLRGFGAAAPDTIERVLACFSDELLDDAFWSTPRSGVAKKTFTATEYPKQRTISLHSEMAYMTTWPRFVGFHALEVADEGGETTLSNLDDVSAEIGDLLEDFAARGVLYRRTYQPGIDIPWQTAFQTERREEVEAIAARIDMEITWLDGDVLQTAHRAQGGVRSEAGDLLWFSQAQIFHQSSVPSADLESMTQLLGADRLPRQAFFGDGGEIPDASIHRVIAALERHRLDVAWRPGDVLIVDNMRFAHGRLPFEGKRRLHVALAQSQSEPRRTPLFGESANTAT